jgi:hypothetical protein
MAGIPLTDCISYSSGLYSPPSQASAVGDQSVAVFSNGQEGSYANQARQVLALGQKVSKKFIGHYGERLVCVRYPYDERRRKRFTTVEIIVKESGWSRLTTGPKDETGYLI